MNTYRYIISCGKYINSDVIAMFGDDLACVRIDTGRYSHVVYSQDTVIFSYVSFMEVYLLLQNPKPRNNVCT